MVTFCAFQWPPASNGHARRSDANGNTRTKHGRPVRSLSYVYCYDLYYSLATTSSSSFPKIGLLISSDSGRELSLTMSESTSLLDLDQSLQKWASRGGARTTFGKVWCPTCYSSRRRARGLSPVADLCRSWSRLLCVNTMRCVGNTTNHYF